MGNTHHDGKTIAQTEPLSSCNVTIDAETAGCRLDAVLAEAVPALSRSRIQALMKAGAVADSAGRLITSPSYKALIGQEFTIHLPLPVPARPVPQAMDLHIAHEDADLVVIDKPAGLVVHPGPGNSEGTLVNGLLAHCGASLSGISGVERPGIVHRIDKDTSGLLVVAKSDAAHQGLTTQFADRSIKRLYIALVWGEPRPLKGTVDAAIGRDPLHRRKMAVRRNGGRPAITHYVMLERYSAGLSSIECCLATGRTHQIRVHMNHVGNPLVGDRLYGGQRFLPQPWRDEPVGHVVNSFGRQALHAARLGFVHPISGEWMSFQSSLPRDMEILFRSLESLKDAEPSHGNHKVL
ncbi:MAG: RluA family pseudouridine synthase [Rhodospirillaceae bacterium]|nr:RluA family pseudouridine synthase [Rhodospirillaceae bacterium]